MPKQLGRVEVVDLAMEHPGRELAAGLVEVVRQLVADRLLVLDGSRRERGDITSGGSPSPTDDAG